MPRRRRSAELSRAAQGRRPRNTRSRTRSLLLFHARIGVPHSSQTFRPCPAHTAPAAPVSSRDPAMTPAPPPPLAKFGPELTGRGPAGPQDACGFKGRGLGSVTRPGGRGGWGRWAARARLLRLWGRPGPRRSPAGPPARPRRRPDNAPLGRTHGAPGAGVTARDMRTRSARPARGPQNTGELWATPPACARLGGARLLVGGVWCGGRAEAHRYRPGSTAPPATALHGTPCPVRRFPRGLKRAPVAAPKGRRQLPARPSRAGRAQG